MKKVFLTLIALAGLSFANAQKVNQKDVPSVVQTSFQKQFPDAKNVKWEKEHGNFEAGFKSNGVETSVVINPSGTLIETEKEIKISELPASATAYIAKTYPKQKIKEAAKITNAKGEVTYEAEIKDKDVLFDNKGKFLKEAKQ